MNALVFNLDELLKILRIDPNGYYYITVANNLKRIIDSGKPITRSVRYNGKVALVFLDEGFIMGHHNQKEFFIHCDTRKETPLTVLGYLYDNSDDPNIAKLIDKIDLDYTGEMVLNLDDVDLMSEMREDHPKELDEMLAFFNKL